ncbi:uncharacterized protein LOC120112019 [Phoenix dactylifera]|uniref:Transcription elongation factor 1 homolog n=1 Tax=Phoenix dactylifera TaxID=42345 RepID=A0A8B9AR92_PHODC|nr:uncharacterized protein LOC120112019 [Phoenix dactylifera]
MVRRHEHGINACEAKEICLQWQMVDFVTGARWLGSGRTWSNLFLRIAVALSPHRVSRTPGHVSTGTEQSSGRERRPLPLTPNKQPAARRPSFSFPDGTRTIAFPSRQTPRLFEVRCDMKNLIGEASCRICQESFSTTITALTEPIDIYSEWMDECERVNNLEDDAA